MSLSHPKNNLDEDYPEGTLSDILETAENIS
jgi:hypothetical protein